VCATDARKEKTTLHLVCRNDAGNSIPQNYVGGGRPKQRGKQFNPGFCGSTFTPIQRIMNSNHGLLCRNHPSTGASKSVVAGKLFAVFFEFGFSRAPCFECRNVM